MRKCSAWDIIISELGFQCTNCGVEAEHSWDIKHKPERSK